MAELDTLLLIAVQVADLKYNTLANGHGPILRYNVEQLVTNYRDWSMAVEKGSTQVHV
jgi:flavorubredoxin